MDLPDELPHEHLTAAQSASLESWVSVMDSHTTGLTVVHHWDESERDEGQVRKRELSTLTHGVSSYNSESVNCFY